MRKIFLIFFIMSLGNINAQNNLPSIGAGFGIGSFSGDFPAQTVFGGKVNFETQSPIRVFDKIGVQLMYAQKIEKFLPGNYKIDYYSYFSAIELSGGFIQPLSTSLIIEENIGFLLLNDRSFDDINTWNLGFELNFGIGTSLTDRIALSLQLDYGLTFTQTNSRYFLTCLIIKYSI